MLAVFVDVTVTGEFVMSCIMAGDSAISLRRFSTWLSVIAIGSFARLTAPGAEHTDIVRFGLDKVGLALGLRPNFARSRLWLYVVVGWPDTEG